MASLYITNNGYPKMVAVETLANLTCHTESGCSGNHNTLDNYALICLCIIHTSSYTLIKVLSCLQKRGSVPEIIRYQQEHIKKERKSVEFRIIRVQRAKLKTG